MSVFKRWLTKPIPTWAEPSSAAQDLFDSAVKEDLGRVEEGQNRGPFVDMINDAAGVARGSFWCATYNMYRIRKTSKKYEVPIQIYISAGVLDGFKTNKARGLIHQNPKKGDVCYMQHADSNLGHQGIVGDVHPDGSHENIEGNTNSNDPTVRNGGMIAIHTRKPGGRYGDLHVIGYATPFPS